MVKKLVTGEYLLERGREGAPVNTLRPRDNAAEEQHELAKKALFRRT